MLPSCACRRITLCSSGADAFRLSIPFNFGMGPSFTTMGGPRRAPIVPDEEMTAPSFLCQHGGGFHCLFSAGGTLHVDFGGVPLHSPVGPGDSACVHDGLERSSEFHRDWTKWCGASFVSNMVQWRAQLGACENRSIRVRGGRAFGLSKRAGCGGLVAIAVTPPLLAGAQWSCIGPVLVVRAGGASFARRYVWIEPFAPLAVAGGCAGVPQLTSARRKDSIPPCRGHFFDELCNVLGSGHVNSRKGGESTMRRTG